MTIFDKGSLDNELSKRTSIFGLHLWVVIGIVLGAVIVLFLFLISLCVTALRRYGGCRAHLHGSASETTPVVSKEIKEIFHESAAEQRPVPQSVPEIHVDIGKVEHRVVFSDRGPSSGESRLTTKTADSGSGACGGSLPEVSHLGWGRWYTLRELEVASNDFSHDNVIGEGGYGIVYYGVLADKTQIAIKNLLNNRGQAEREFKVEVEVIGRARHKNLVRLLGYCAEGAHRSMASWRRGETSPLTWGIRVNIILGIAKGLDYLHEGLELKVVHRDVKSSNILLNHQWNPKLSDFGLAKLLNSDTSYVTTRVMGTFGYVAPEYASTGMLTEKSDIYSFGVLIMELITGRSPSSIVDQQERKSEEVVDPKLPQKPTSKALKRLIMIALRCIDIDAKKRPKIRHVIQMLEFDDLLSIDEGSSVTSKFGATGEELYPSAFTLPL